MKMKSGRMFKVIESNCPVKVEAYYQSNLNQLTLYLGAPIEESDLRRLKTIIAAYIGDHMLQDSFKTVKYFY